MKSDVTDTCAFFTNGILSRDNIFKGHVWKDFAFSEALQHRSS